VQAEQAVRATGTTEADAAQATSAAQLQAQVDATAQARALQNEQATAQAWQVATTQSVNTVQAQATFQTQQEAQKNAAQQSQQATAQALQVQFQQATAQALQAQSQQATAQALQAQFQQATALAKEQAKQAATSQAQQAQQATARAQADAQATANAEAEARAQATARAQDTITAQTEATAQSRQVAVQATVQSQAAEATAFVATQTAVDQGAPTAVGTPVGQATFEHLTFNLERPLFQDKRVRQAIAFAINRQRIVDQVYPGQPVMHTPMSPEHWCSLQNAQFAALWGTRFPLTRYGYDPGKASQFLDQAGWITGADGIRTRDGTRFSFEYVTSSTAIRRQIADMVAADLRAVGIEARIVVLSAAEYFGLEGPLSQRRFDVAQFAWVSHVGDYFVLSTYTSVEVPSFTNDYLGTNFGSYRNAGYDELVRAVYSELGRTDISPYLAEAQSILSDDLPVIPLLKRP
jgi:hypothetical protein